MGFLGILCLILITTTLAGVACKKVEIPTVVGQLLVGIVLDPTVLNTAHQDVFVYDFSETGVIVLMFTAGMKCELGLLKKYAKPSAMIVILDIALPIGFIMLIGRLLALSQKGAFLLGLALITTSVSISIEVLRELNASGSKEGTTIPRAFVVGDIVVVIVLSIAADMVGVSTGGSTEVSFIVKLIE